MKKFPVTIFANLRGVCDLDPIEAETIEEAVAKARLIDPLSIEYFPVDDGRVDELADLDCLIDVSWPVPEDMEHEVETLDMRPVGEPMAIEAVAIVKELAKLAKDDDATTFNTSVEALIARAARALKQEGE